MSHIPRGRVPHYCQENLSDSCIWIALWRCSIFACHYCLCARVNWRRSGGLLRGLFRCDCVCELFIGLLLGTKLLISITTNFAGSSVFAQGCSQDGPLAMSTWNCDGTSIKIVRSTLLWYWCIRRSFSSVSQFNASIWYCHLLCGCPLWFGPGSTYLQFPKLR